VSWDERQALAKGADVHEVAKPLGALACYKNVWDSANRARDQQVSVDKALIQERAETCFFYRHVPGMFFPAASELEQRAAERREAQKDRLVTRGEGKRGRRLARSEGQRDRQLSQEEGAQERELTRRAVHYMQIAVWVSVVATFLTLVWNVIMYFNPRRMSTEVRLVSPDPSRSQPEEAARDVPLPELDTTNERTTEYQPITPEDPSQLAPAPLPGP